MGTELSPGSSDPVSERLEDSNLYDPHAVAVYLRLFTIADNGRRGRSNMALSALENTA